MKKQKISYQGMIHLFQQGYEAGKTPAEIFDSQQKYYEFPSLWTIQKAALEAGKAGARVSIKARLQTPFRKEA